MEEKCGPALGDLGRDYLGRMQSAAGRMRALIQDLLTFSRLSTQVRQLAPVNLSQIAAEVVSDLEVRIGQTGGRVDVGELPTVDADPLQMRQLFLNLVGNGLKFHRPEEPPVIKVESEIISSRERPVNGDGRSKLCRITVQDNGIGFEETYLDRIFEVFQRLHGRQEYEGTGIGLAICRRKATAPRKGGGA